MNILEFGHRGEIQIQWYGRKKGGKACKTAGGSALRRVNALLARRDFHESLGNILLVGDILEDHISLHKTLCQLCVLPSYPAPRPADSNCLFSRILNAFGNYGERAPSSQSK